MCLNFKRTLNDRGMEKKKVTVELTVLTQRSTADEILHDIEHLAMPLQKLEYGQTAVCNVNVAKVDN